MNKIYQKTHPAGENAGFTLIELLVVVLIIGILAAVALPQYQKAVEKSRAAEGLAMMRSLAMGFDEYVMANGEIPTSFDQISITPIKSTANGSCVASKNFRYCLEYSRLQSWSQQIEQYGFLWYSGMQEIGSSGKQFYCYELKNSSANKMNICQSIGGKNKMDSLTNSAYYWYALD